MGQLCPACTVPVALQKFDTGTAELNQTKDVEEPFIYVIMLIHAQTHRLSIRPAFSSFQPGHPLFPFLFLLVASATSPLQIPRGFTVDMH